MWDTHPGLIPTVQNAWEANGPNLAAAEVRANLAALSNNLGEWSKKSFGSVKGEIRRLKKELDKLRNDPHRAGSSHAEIKINDRLIELYLREELMWRQRSRVQWLLEGDRNTHFFHLRASMRRRKNLIKSLQKQDGQVTKDLTEMQTLALEYYKNLYCSEGVPGMEEVLQHVPVKVTAAMNDQLLAPYTEGKSGTLFFKCFPLKHLAQMASRHCFIRSIGMCVVKRLLRRC